MRHGYLTGDVAVDVARMTGLVLNTTTGRFGKPVRYLDLDRIHPWDRFLVFWALLGATHFMENA